MAEALLLGVPNLLANLKAIAQENPKRLARALYAEAQIEMREAKKRTPVETGALRASGIVKSPEVKDNMVSVQLEFGGPSAAYAIWVHENLEAFHKVGQAKFLESVLLESVPYMAERLAARLKV